MAYYIDTSGLVKLVVREPESEALRSWLATNQPTLVTADLTRTELLRATRRAAPDQIERARAVLNSLTTLTVTTGNFDSAGRLDPVTVRSLDAIHLAVALDLGDDLDGLVTYDSRMAEAAVSHGIPVLAPS